MELARNEAKTSAMRSVPLLFKYTNVNDRLKIFRRTCDCMVAPSLASTPDEQLVMTLTYDWLYGCDLALELCYRNCRYLVIIEGLSLLVSYFQSGLRSGSSLV